MYYERRYCFGLAMITTRQYNCVLTVVATSPHNYLFTPLWQLYAYSGVRIINILAKAY